MEFKVGDKLKCVAPPTGARAGWYTIGNVYEIVGKDEQTNQFVITCDSNKFKIAFERSCIKNLFQRIDKPQVDQNEQQPQVIKVVLTQEQAEALERLKSITYNNSELILEYNDVLTSPSALSVEKFSAALLIGYEVEKTASQ